MGSFSCKSNKFIKWLSKRGYDIYSRQLFNTFASVYKSDISITENDFVIKRLPFIPFVLHFSEYPNIAGYEALDLYAKELASLKIILVIIHDSCTLKDNSIPSALTIKIDSLKDYTDKFMDGVRVRTFCFEDKLLEYLRKFES